MVKTKVIIVMPAFNAAKTVHDSYFEIPKILRKNIILVDDKSTDKTAEVAGKLGIKIFEHPNNLGYGGSQKTCYKQALKLKPDIVVMLHPDYQYDGSMIEDLIFPIARGRYDFMFGSRIANKAGALKGGMPAVKYYVNRIVCLLQNILLGVNFTEHFSGFRAYSRHFLEKIPFEKFSNDFVFDQEMTIAAINHGFSIGEIAIPTRYHQKASSIKFWKGVKFILGGFLVITRLYLHKMGIIKDSRFLAEKVVKDNLLALCAIVLVNLIFSVYKFNLLFIALIFIESILLYFVFTGNKFLKATLLVLFILIFFSFKNGFDNHLVKLTSLEADTLVARHEHFARELGKIYKNRISINYTKNIRPQLIKFNRNLFSHLDFILFFNLNNVFSLSLIPLFLIGLYQLLQKLNKFLTIYLTVVFISGGFLSAGGEYGHLLYMPFFNLVTFLGLMQFLQVIKYVKA